MCRRQSIPFTPDTFPEGIKVLLGSVHNLTYPRQGWTSDLAIADCDSGTYVIKRAQGEQFSNWLAREYFVLQALNNLPLPLPHPYHFVRRNLSELPEAWLVMSYLPGQSLRVLAQTEHDQMTRRAMLYAVGQALATLHSLPIPPTLAVERQEPWLDHMLKQARYNLQHYKVDGSAELLAQLERHRHSMVQPTLIHGDFAIDNVLILNGQVSGIVDWAWGAVGDPRYDLALAMRPKEGLFQSSQDVHSFLSGYGIGTLSKDEYEYFIGLYEFF